MESNTISSHNLADFLSLLTEKDASDLYLTVGVPPQVRVHGELHSLDSSVLHPDDLNAIARSFLTDTQYHDLCSRKDLDTSIGVSGLGRFRINLFWQRGSLTIVVRVIPHEIPSLRTLGLPSVLEVLSEYSRGLILVTGPAGSGKSTTLASLIEFINERRRTHIITLEDPIEYLHRHKRSIIHQREIGTDTVSFKHALKHVLRQDPDIVLIGEMRDLETIQTALTLAETGHLILSTLHTQDAKGAISRIVDSFSADKQEQIRLQLSLVMVAVIAQALVSRCDQHGRVLACEVMRATAPIANLIRENRLHQIPTVIQTGAQHGMCTMNQSLAHLCNQGVITYEEACKRSTDLEDLKQLIRRNN